MDLLIVSRVTFEACVEIAAKHDAHLNGAKGLADACEFHLNLQKLRNLDCFESKSGEDVIQQVNDNGRDTAADSRSE